MLGKPHPEQDRIGRRTARPRPSGTGRSSRRATDLSRIFLCRAVGFGGKGRLVGLTDVGRLKYTMGTGGWQWGVVATLVLLRVGRGSAFRRQLAEAVMDVRAAHRSFEMTFQAHDVSRHVLPHLG